MIVVVSSIGFIGSSFGCGLRESESFWRPTSMAFLVTGLAATALAVLLICSYRARPARVPSTYPAATPTNNPINVSSFHPVCASSLSCPMTLCMPTCRRFGSAVEGALWFFTHRGKPRSTAGQSPVAQLAEHSTVNRRVAGSSPAGGAQRILPPRAGWEDSFVPWPIGCDVSDSMAGSKTFLRVVGFPRVDNLREPEPAEEGPNRSRPGA